MAQTPPPQKPPQRRNFGITNVEPVRNFLLYAFGISILLHLIFGPLLKFQTPHTEEEQKTEVVKIEKVTVPTPKPTLPPTPPPTPTPRQTPPPTPPPKVQTPQPERPKLKLNVPKSSSKGSGPSEQTYKAPPKGSDVGTTQGNVASAPPAPAPAATAPPAPPTPPPTPTPTPRPQCAVPNADATAVNKVTPEMPEIARQMGATGTAQIQVSLSAGGAIQDVSIYKSTGNKALDTAAMQAARQSTYKAEVVNCVPTAGKYIYVVTFENS